MGTGQRGIADRTLIAILVVAFVLVAAAAGGWMLYRRQERNERRYLTDLARARNQTRAGIRRLAEAAWQREAVIRDRIRRLKTAGAAPPAESGDPGPRISEANRKSLYLLAFGRKDDPRYALCTAFAVAKRIVATNAHCVAAVNRLAAKGAHFYVVQNENPAFRAAAVAVKLHPRYDRFNFSLSPDVGLIRVDRDLPATVRVANEAQLARLKPGHMVFSFGFPGRLADAKKTVATLVQGRVGRLTRFDGSVGLFDENRLIQHSAITTGGASGSPMFDVQGNVVGIHAGAYTALSPEALFGRGRSAPASVVTIRRSGFKLAIRIDCLETLLRPDGFQPVEVTGTLKMVTILPPALRSVNCARFGRKMAGCTGSARVGAAMRKQCDVIKKVLSPSSVDWLKMVQCILKVPGCARKKLKACFAALRKKK